MIALTLTSRPLSDPHVFPGFLRVGLPGPVVPVARYAFSLGRANLGPRFRRHRASSAVMSCVTRLNCFLQVPRAVIRRIFVDVVDDLATPDRVVRVGPVPDVDVPEDVSVLVHRRVQMTLTLGDPDEHATVAGARLCTAAPVVVVRSSIPGRQLGARLCAGVANSGVVGALPGAELRHKLRRVVAREVNTALGTRGRGLHKTDYTQPWMEA